MNINNIINLNSIGFPFASKNSTNFDLSTILYNETYTEDFHKNLLLIIDPQNDFMEDGSLPVKGSREDMINLISFIHTNLQKIDKIKISLDTHSYTQIFFQSWWKDSNGKHPDFFTQINKSSQFMPIFHKDDSINYINYLEKVNKELIIWPYHCILGTYGHNIEPNLEQMLSYFSLVTKKKVERFTKGSNPLSEMYGIFREEYSEVNTTIDPIIAKAYGKYENIIIAGEAKSHCVLETVKQLCEFYQFNDFNSKIHILEDCTSSIEGFNKKTDEEFDKLKKNYNIILTNSKKIIL